MMATHRFSTALRDSARRRLEALDHADIVIGIPTFNTASSIAHVMKIAVRGLQRYFPNLRGLVLVSDGGSVDDTREEAESVHIDSYNVETLVTIYRGLPGKGSAVRAILEASQILRARACILVDGDLRSITPEWIRNLAEPIVDLGYDFVAPLYRRFRFDATITNTVVYNLTRALYGYRIRQPIGGDFGMSRAAILKYLSYDVWETDIARFGIDIWLTVNAIVHQLRICQTRLGAKIHDIKDPGQHLGPMFRQVVGTVFQLMQEYETYWKNIRGSREVDTHGEPPGSKPEPFEISIEPLIESFVFGFKVFGSVWEKIVDPSVFRQLEKLAESPSNDFHIPTEAWVRIVYDFATAYKNWPRHKGKLLDIMLPLYNARVASLVTDLSGIPEDEVELYFDRQAEVFEQYKDYLLRKWEDPEESKKWQTSSKTES